MENLCEQASDGRSAGKEAMEQVIAAEKKYLEEEWKPLETSIQ